MKDAQNLTGGKLPFRAILYLYFFYYFLPSSLVLSDRQVYEPQIRAFRGIASHIICTAASSAPHRAF
jgi:hypothetical protein